MAVKTFLLPDLGEGLTEAELVNWLVRVGDPVAVDQPIAEVETAKSLVEVPSPFAGFVHQLHGAAGDTIDVGKPLISVADDARSGGPASGPQGGSAVPAEGALPYREEERAGAKVPGASTAPVPALPAAAEESESESGSGNVLIGYGTSGRAAKGRTRRPRTSGTGRGPVAPAAGTTPDGRIGAAAATATAQADRGSAPLGGPHRGRAALVVSPIVRKLARDHGLDVSALAGSGPDGLVLRGDVEAAIGGRVPARSGTTMEAAQPSAAVGGPGPEAVPSGTAPRETAAGETDARSGLPVVERTPVKGVRKAVAQAMARSRSEIPEATVWVDVDATLLLELRAALKKSDPDGAPGLLAFIARFALAGLARFPELNTRLETTGDGGQEIVSFDGVNLGFAAQTERGLVVPSIRAAHRLSARALDAELRRLTGLAREGKATPADLTSGTFTINNYGVFGVDGSAAIINYPEAAILGIGRIIDRPWVVDGQLAVRSVVELTLTFDHRVCDGGTAGGFLRYVADAVENPGSVLADL